MKEAMVRSNLLRVKMSLLGRPNTYVSLVALIVVLLLNPGPAAAQRGRGAPPATPRAGAPADLTGYWVSIVTEDWIWRMTTPKPGDMGAGPDGGLAPFPLTPAGRQLTLAWDPAKDEAEGNQCKSYGAGNFLNVPGRLHITWADDNTLKVELDAGMQTRLFHFGDTLPDNPPRDWQGYSVASWDGITEFESRNLGPRQGRGPLISKTFGTGGGSRNGNLKVITTGMKPGYLRKNGVPYSDKMVLEEHFRVFTEPNGDTWLITTALVTDPTYLTEPFLVSRNFKKERDGSKWSPSPCTVR